MAKEVAKKSVKTKTTPYDVSEHLRTPEEIAAYLDAWFEEAPDDVAGIARARSLISLFANAGPHHTC
jgi:DNA-binding phage protein